CAQQVNLEAWSFKAFTIHENVAEVFGSREDFILFIKEHKDAKTAVIEEFVCFFDLCKRTRFTKKILFSFQKSSKMLNKIQSRKEESSNQYSEEFKKSKQIMFSTNFKQAV